MAKQTKKTGKFDEKHIPQHIADAKTHLGYGDKVTAKKILKHILEHKPDCSEAKKLLDEISA